MILHGGLGVLVSESRGGSKMNPVVGLDVAKGESQVQAFLDKSKPFGKRRVRSFYKLFK